MAVSGNGSANAMTGVMTVAAAPVKLEERMVV
jgi:hypothetical protein